jgi:hypothetical protein
MILSKNDLKKDVGNGQFSKGGLNRYDFSIAGLFYPGISANSFQPSARWWRL